MIKIILTKSGWEIQKDILDYTNDIVWINSGILTIEEINQLRSNGLNMTSWTHLHVGTTESIESAIETVKEHHPNEEIWCEEIRKT